MMIYTILFLCIIRTDRLFLLSPDNAPEISSEAIEVLQCVQFIFLKGLKSYKVSKLFFWSFRTTISSTRGLSSPSESRNNTTNRYCSF